MRLFVAVVPPEPVRRHLQQALDGLAGAAPFGSTGLRLPGADRWHVTLTFCGEVDEARRTDLEARLARAAGRHAALRLRLAGAGAFPRASRAQVLWIGADGEVDRLGRLAASTSAAARRAGVPVEGRRFRAHLTVARCRPEADLRETVAALAGYRGPDWLADELRLVRSRVGRGPVKYETIAAWPLRDGG